MPTPPTTPSGSPTPNKLATPISASTQAARAAAAAAAAAAAQSGAPATAAAAAAPKSAAPITVVVADDHALIRSALVGVLNATPDIRVVGEASTAEEAHNETLARSPRILVLDVDMPGKDAFQLIVELRKERPATDVLVLSGSVQDRLIQSARQVGAKGYVAKIDRTDAVIEAIQSIARGQSYFSAAVQSRIVPEEIKRSAGSTKGERLSDRELEVLRYVGRGFAKKQIAEMMNISVKTVDKHVTTVMDKLDIHDRVELARYAIREGLINA
jgi:DNA-binding NarL/FixJ family response regulator